MKKLLLAVTAALFIAPQVARAGGCENGICANVPNGPSGGGGGGLVIVPGGAAVLAPGNSSSNANATSSGAAWNEQRNNSNSYSTGGDLNNYVIQPAAFTPSVNTISAGQVACQGPSFTVGTSLLPQDNSNGYWGNQSSVWNNIQVNAGFTLPLGGAGAQCRSIARLIEEQKMIDTSAGILKLCLQTMDQKVDLTRLDPVVFPWAKKCSTVFKVTVPEPIILPAPPVIEPPAPVHVPVRARG